MHGPVMGCAPSSEVDRIGGQVRTSNSAKHDVIRGDIRIRVAGRSRVESGSKDLAELALDIAFAPTVAGGDCKP